MNSLLQKLGNLNMLTSADRVRTALSLDVLFSTLRRRILLSKYFIHSRFVTPQNVSKLALVTQ